MPKQMELRAQEKNSGTVVASSDEPSTNSKSDASPSTKQKSLKSTSPRHTKRKHRRREQKAENHDTAGPSRTSTSSRRSFCK